MPETQTSTGWVTALLVVPCGAVGGFTSWVYSLTLGEPLPTEGWTPLAGSVFLGTVAAFVGVFVLARNPTRALMHTLGLAVLMGFAWKPVFEAGRELVITRVQEGVAQSAIDEADRQLEKLKYDEAENAAVVIEQLETSSRELLEQAEKIRSPRLRSEINRVVSESVSAIDQAAEQAPEESARALGTIGAAASSAHRTGIADAAARSLISVAERSSFEVGTASEVSNSLLRLSAAARAQQRDDESWRLRGEGAEVFERAREQAERQRNAEVVLEELRSRSIIERERPPEE